MVDRAIKVAILARRFCSHVWLRFPLALSFQLQKNALKLSEALWTAKSSGSGFSVSLFWPSSTASNLKSQKYSKRRCRRKPKATIKVDVATSTTTPVHLSLFNANLESLSPNTVDINSKLTTPGTSAASLPVTNELPVHSPSSKNQSACSDSCDDRDTVTEPEVNLLSCTEVAYEKRDGTRGVSYCDSSSKYQWTPVVGKRRRLLCQIMCCDGSLPTTTKNCTQSAQILSLLVLISHIGYPRESISKVYSVWQKTRAPS